MFFFTYCRLKNYKTFYNFQIQKNTFFAFLLSFNKPFVASGSVSIQLRETGFRLLISKTMYFCPQFVHFQKAVSNFKGTYF